MTVAVGLACNTQTRGLAVLFVCPAAGMLLWRGMITIHVFKARANHGPVGSLMENDIPPVNRIDQIRDELKALEGRREM